MSVQLVHGCQCEECNPQVNDPIARAMAHADAFAEFEKARGTWLAQKVIRFPVERTRAKGQL